MERPSEKPERRRSQRPVARVLLSIASLLLVLGIAEVIARVTWHEVEHRPIERRIGSQPFLYVAIAAEPYSCLVSLWEFWGHCVSVESAT